MSGFVKNDPRLEFDEDTHTYSIGGSRLTSVTQVLALTGLAQFDSPWFTEAVKARGTALHAAIALDVEEADIDPDTLSPDIQRGLDGWRRFLADTGAEVEHWERRLCDPQLGIAGRMDGVVRMRIGNRDRRVVLDIKRALYPCAAIQLVAYADMAAALYETHMFFARAALVLPCDGSYRFQMFSDETDKLTWAAAVRVVNWRTSHGLAA